MTDTQTDTRKPLTKQMRLDLANELFTDLSEDPEFLRAFVDATTNIMTEDEYYAYVATNPLKYTTPEATPKAERKKPVRVHKVTKASAEVHRQRMDQREKEFAERDMADQMVEMGYADMGLAGDTAKDVTEVCNMLAEAAVTEFPDDPSDIDPEGD